MNVTMIKKAVGYSALFAGGMVCGSAVTVGKIVSKVKKFAVGFGKFLAENNPENKEQPHTFKFEEEKKELESTEEEKIEGNNVFVLYIEHRANAGDRDTLLIGVFDSWAKAANYGVKLVNEHENDFAIDYFVIPCRLNDERPDPLRNVKEVVD